MKNNKAIVRLYEELNEYIPKNLHKREIEFVFNKKCSVKEICMGWNIPVTSVDLVLKNGRSVNLDATIRDGDRISIYPVFETFDISQTTKIRNSGLRNSRFIADAHLGKLAKYLRILGFDTVYHSDLDDNEIINLSLEEHRIILSKDKELLQNKKVTHALRIHSESPIDQLLEVIFRLDVKEYIKPFRLCTICNNKLEFINKEDILPRLLPKTRENYNEFYICQNCNKIYWKGSHYDRLKLRLGEFIK